MKTELFSYDFPVAVSARFVAYVYTTPKLSIYVVERNHIVGLVHTSRFSNEMSDLRVRTYPDCEVVTKIQERWSGVKAILDGDFLYIYEPETDKAFSVDSKSPELVLWNQYSSGGLTDG